MSKLQLGVEILEIINNNGYAAYIVGGAVRDHLLGKPIDDVDIATSMPIDKLASLFTVIETGINYLGVTVNYKNNLFEITNFRIELSYQNHRHPEVRLVKSLEEDVKRRDFTINALAYDSNLKLYDFFNGVNDLNNKIIKSIGDANIKFEQDALRILRALYFASKLDFYPDYNVIDGMINKKGLLKELSDERLYFYLKKLLYFTNKKGIDLINKYDLFSEIPEYKRWLSCIDDSYNEEDLPIYYYIKYNEFPAITTNKIKRLALIIKELIDNNFSKYYLYKFKEEFSLIKEVINNLGYDIISIENIINGFVISCDSDLALSKQEISSLFNGENKAIAIKMVIEAVLDRSVNNKKEDILEFIKGFDFYGR